MSTIRCFVALLVAVAAGGASIAATEERSGAATATNEIRLADATIELSYTGNAAGLDRNEVREWITASANAVQTYYGRFPVKRVRIRIEAGEGRGAQSGTTYAHNGALIRVGVGRFSNGADLKRDWIMTHEMVHLAMPEFSDRHAWLEEGLATYVEPIARVQAGQLTEETIWRDMLRDMSKGLPAPGDQGLDNTHTWGRTYWGARCSIFWQTCASANAPAIAWAFRMRYAPLSPMAATSKCRGTCGVRWRWATRLPAPMS